MSISYNFTNHRGTHLPGRDTPKSSATFVHDSVWVLPHPDWSDKKFPAFQATENRYFYLFLYFVSSIHYVASAPDTKSSKAVDSLEITIFHCNYLKVCRLVDLISPALVFFFSAYSKHLIWNTHKGLLVYALALANKLLYFINNVVYLRPARK